MVKKCYDYVLILRAFIMKKFQVSNFDIVEIVLLCVVTLPSKQVNTIDESFATCVCEFQLFYPTVLMVAADMSTGNSSIPFSTYWPCQLLSWVS